MSDESKQFRFLSDTEFSALDADAKAFYLVEATKAMTAITTGIRAHVERRDDEIAGTNKGLPPDRLL